MKGFTLLEIVIVVALSAVLSTFGIVSFRSLQNYTELDSAANQIVAVLREARDRALTGSAPGGYGIHFEENRYVRFVGPSYASGTPTNVIYYAPSSLQLYDIHAGGDSNIIFDPVDGAPDSSGSTSIRIIDDPSQYRTIHIFSTGAIGTGDAIASTGGRAVDTRHAHFDLGWSIQSANILTLRFSDSPNPDTVQNISMASYKNAGNTEFDWSGTVTVGGAPQTLRIHTHLLSGINTILSIHRDRRFNTKALSVSIDGKEIVSYATNGDASVGLFGGTMEIQ